MYTCIHFNGYFIAVHMWYIFFSWKRFSIFETGPGASVFSPSLPSLDVHLVATLRCNRINFYKKLTLWPHLWYNVNIAPLWRLIHFPCVNELENNEQKIKDEKKPGCSIPETEASHFPTETSSTLDQTQPPSLPPGYYGKLQNISKLDYKSPAIWESRRGKW